jgi:hypothetical protein
VEHLFNDWATSVGNRFKKITLVGAAAVCWAMWTSQNNMVFDNSLSKTYMQLLF